MPKARSMFFHSMHFLQILWVGLYQISPVCDMPSFKRPCQYNFTHFRYTFFKIHFLLNSTNFELKPHGEPIQLDFWAQKGGFWGLWNFFWKIIDFQAKTKKKIYQYFLPRNVPILVWDINSCYFYHTSPSKGLKRPKHGIYGVFGDFWWLLLQAK